MPGWGRIALAATTVAALAGGGVASPGAAAVEVYAVSGPTLALTGTPASIAVDGPAGKAYVVLTGAVQIVDIAGVTGLGTISTPGSYQAAVDPVRHRLFVTDASLGRIYVYGVAGAPVLLQTVTGFGSGLAGIDVNPVDGRVYAAVEAGCKCVRVLAPSGPSSYVHEPLIPIITVPGPPKPNDVSVDWVANRLYVSVHHTSNGIAVVDLATNTRTFQPSLSGDMTAVAAAPGHNAVFGGGFGAGITRLDGATLTPTNVGGIGQVPFMSYDPASDRLYAASLSASTLHVVDGSGGGLASLALGAGTFNGGIAAIPGTGCAMVALRAPDRVQKVCGGPAPGATPVVNGSVTPAANAAGWHNAAPVAVGFTVNDRGHASVARTGCGPASQLADTAGTTFTCTATNGAGYTGTASRTVKLDTVDPVVGFTGLAASYALTDTITAGCTFSDALSGIAVPSQACSVPSGPAVDHLGGGTAQASADDVAGNTGSASQAYTVVVDAAGLCALAETYTDQPGSLCAGAASIASAPNAQARAGKLKAFVNHVEAQRGKKLSAAEADALVAVAQLL